MLTGLTEKLQSINESLQFVIPELILSIGIFLLITLGLINGIKNKTNAFHLISLLIFTSSFIYIIINWSAYTTPTHLFNRMIRSDDFSACLKLLFNVSGMLTVIMTWM